MDEHEKSHGIKKSNVAIRFASKKPSSSVVNSLLVGAMGVISLISTPIVYLMKVRSDDAHHNQIEQSHNHIEECYGVINRQSAYIMQENLESIAITARSLDLLLKEAEDVVGVISSVEEQEKLYENLDELREAYLNYKQEKNKLIERGQESGSVYNYPEDQREFIRVSKAGREISKDVISIIHKANEVKKQEKLPPKGEEKNWTNMVIAQQNDLPKSREFV